MQLLRFCTWFGTVIAAGTLIGIVASTFQRAGFSPLLINSLLLGMALAVAAIAASRFLRIECRRLLLLGTLLASLALVFSQHYALYLAYTAEFEKTLAEKPELVLFRNVPVDLISHLRQESADGRAWLWFLDGAIISATAAGITIWMQPRSGVGNME